MGTGHDHDHDGGHGRHGEHRHHHGHRHDHAGGTADFGTAFALGAALNIAFLAAEAAFGVIAHSMALIADAGHNLSDVLALGMAWGAATLVRRRPSQRFTYGLRSSSILAALVNAALLLVVTGGIGWEAILRLLQPAPVAGGTMATVAAAGVVVNGATALLFMAGRRGDINIRAAFLHMLADAVVSGGVAAAGLVILVTGWIRLDPAVSLVIAVVIIAATWSLFREAASLALDAVPAGIEPEAVRRHLEQMPGVAGLHDLHIWPMSTTETALTCHLVMPRGHPGDTALAEAARELNERFAIQHVTLQVELGDAPEQCVLTPDHLV